MPCAARSVVDGLELRYRHTASLGVVAVAARAPSPPPPQLAASPATVHRYATPEYAATSHLEACIRDSKDFTGRWVSLRTLHWARRVIAWCSESGQCWGGVSRGCRFQFEAAEAPPALVAATTSALEDYLQGRLNLSLVAGY
jgi:hypothetical protein